MRVVPFIGAPVALAGQIWADPASTKHLRHVIDELARLAHRTPFVGVAVDRAHELRMAVPATLANVDLATQVLDIGTMRRRYHLAIDGNDRLGTGQRFFQIRNEPLARHRQPVEAQRRDQNNRFDAIQLGYSSTLRTTLALADSQRGPRPAAGSTCRAGWSYRDSRIR